MRRTHHFVLEANFLLDVPFFPNRFAFDADEFSLVISDALLRELDTLKHDEDYRVAARQASQSLDGIDRLYPGRVVPGDLPLPVCHVVRYADGMLSLGHRADRFLHVAEKYAEEHPEAQVVLLTKAVALRSLARDERVTVEHPDEWQQEVRDQRDCQWKLHEASKKRPNVPADWQARCELEAQADFGAETPELLQSSPDARAEEDHILAEFEAADGKASLEEERRRPAPTAAYAPDSNPHPPSWAIGCGLLLALAFSTILAVCVASFVLSSPFLMPR